MSIGIQRILVPTDFSEYNHAVMAFATSLARDNDATLVIAHAVDLQSPATAVPLAPNMPIAPPPVDNRDIAREQLRNVRPTDEVVRYEHRLVDGTPSDAMIQLIEDEKIDLVVMGTHGRTGLLRLLMGSVAEAVVRRATCPVLTLRPPVAEQVSSMGQSSGSAASEASFDSPVGPAKMHESREPADTDRKEDVGQYIG